VTQLAGMAWHGCQVTVLQHQMPHLLHEVCHELLVAKGWGYLNCSMSLKKPCKVPSSKASVNIALPAKQLPLSTRAAHHLYTSDKVHHLLKTKKPLLEDTAVFACRRCGFQERPRLCHPPDAASGAFLMHLTGRDIGTLHVSELPAGVNSHCFAQKPRVVAYEQASCVAYAVSCCQPYMPRLVPFALQLSKLLLGGP